MGEGSEVRKTSHHEKELPNNLRQRRSFCSFSAFCSFCESPDDESGAGDESLWPVRALFLAVAALAQGCPTGAKGWAWPVAPVSMSAPRGESPTVGSTPAAADEPAPADCAHRRRCASSVRSAAVCSAVAHPRATPVCQSDSHVHASSASDTSG